MSINLRRRIYNAGLLLAFLICYLEWGGGNNGFIFQLEYEVTDKFFSGTTSVFHPLIILPFAGQILLLFTIFQHAPSKRLTMLAILMLGSLVLMILLVGVLSLNVKVIFSVLPFIILTILSIRLPRTG